MPRLRSTHAPQKLRQYLRQGGVIAYPTESCYGLGASAKHINAIKRILKIKKRPQNKGLITIGHNWQQLKPLVQALPDTQQQQLQQQWQQHSRTFLLPIAPHKIPVPLRGKRRDKLAVRVPQHPIARQLCHLAQSPLISTSCNRAGQRPCLTQREAQRQFGKQVCVVGGQIGKQKHPSEIIDWISKQRLR